MIFRIRHIAFVFVWICHTLAFSQTYPVQTFVQVSPPHTSYLPDYSDPFSNQMKIFLTLTDFTVPSYQVKLRFTLTGNGYSITTSSLLNLPTTTLSPGSPVEISGSDLAPYLSSQNLLFSGIDVADYEIRKVLPEGPCQICLEVIDFSNPNQAVLSNPACTQVWFSLNDPPLLNTPFCGNQITPTDPQQLIFSWTPLHMNSLHSAGTNYVFELFEIRPDGADPNQVVNSSLPIFMQVTDQTFINYGITEPQLQTGMSYVWRVRAQDIQGRDFFRNNGYSSVCTFTYGNIAESLADGITLTLNTAGTGTRKGDAWWNVSATFTNYKVEVRKTGNPDYEWFPYESTTGELKIYQLEPSTQYECRVKGLIGTEYESEWSNTSIFTTQPLIDYACGSTTQPPGEINFTPLTNAIAGLTFEIGQFELLVTDIEPLDPILQPGHYKGTGKIAVGFAIINIRVSFDDILVDDNLKVRSGKVEAITEGMDAWLAGTIEPDYYVDGTITDFEWNDSTSLTVWVDGVPQTFSFSDHDHLVIQDEDGMVYSFNSDGTYTVISILIYSTDVLAGTADYRIDFSPDPNQIYGFDKKEYAAWLHDYEVIRLLDSSNYFVSYKSLAPDQTDYVIANVTSENPLSNVTFVAQTLTGTTNLASEQINDSTYRVTLAGMSSSFYVYAEDDGNRIGKLWVKVLPAIEKEIVFVPVNGASLSQIAEIENELNEIYIQANVSFEVTTKSNYESSSWDLDTDGKLQTGDVDLMSHYSEEMRLLRDEYFASDTGYNKNAYYIFIIPQFLQDDLGGYMVRGKGVGFLKNGESPRTAAHELAHGIFALEHTFPAIEEGTTENLLDYSNGTHLAQKQWYYMHNPLPAFSFLDDEESGAYAVLTNLNGRLIYMWLNQEDMASYDFNSIYTPAGDVIKLNDPSVISKISFDVLTGGVTTFHYNNIKYCAHYSVPISTHPQVFIGYYRYDYWAELRKEYVSYDEMYADTVLNFSMYARVNHHAFMLAGHNDLYFTEFTMGMPQDISLAMVASSDGECSRQVIKFTCSETYESGPIFDDLNQYQHPLMGDYNSLLESDIVNSNPVVLDDEIFNVNLSEANRDLLCRLIVIYDQPSSFARWQIDYIVAINQIESVYDLGMESTTFLTNVVTIAEAYEEFGTELIELYGVQINNIGCLDALGNAFLNSFGFDIAVIQQPNTGEEYAEALVQKIRDFRERYSDITNSNDASETLSILQYFESEELGLLSVDTRIKFLKIIAAQMIHLNSEEGLAVRLVQSCPLDQATEFLTRLDQAIPIEGEILGESSLLYELIDDIYGDESGPFLIGLFDLWTNSIYYDFDYADYDYSSPACYYSPDNTRYIIDYQSEEGFAGFYNSNYEVDRSNRLVSVEEVGVGNCSQEFSAYQPIGLVSIDQTGVMSMPGYGVPAFYLYAFEQSTGEANMLLASKIAFDVVLTLTGVGNLAKLRYLSAVKSLSLGQKTSIIIGGVEFTSGMASVVLEYACDDESEWCNEIKNVLFMIEVASLGTDILLKQLIKIRCQRIINNNLMPANAPNDLKEIVNRYADESAVSLTGVQAVDDFLKLTPKIDEISPSSLPPGYQIYVLNGSKYIRRVDVSNASTPKLMVDETGTIVKYNRPLRPNNQPQFISNLKLIYGPMPLNHQRHHLVPVNVVQSSAIHQEAMARGLYSVDRGSNGRYLAETDEDYILDPNELSSQFPTHLGSHPNYDAEIIGIINESTNQLILQFGSISNVPNDVLIGVLMEIEEDALEVLLNWQPSKLN